MYLLRRFIIRIWKGVMLEVEVSDFIISIFIVESILVVVESSTLKIVSITIPSTSIPKISKTFTWLDNSNM